MQCVVGCACMWCVHVCGVWCVGVCVVCVWVCGVCVVCVEFVCSVWLSV